MLDALARIDPADHALLREAIDDHLAHLPILPRGDRSLVHRAEEDVQRDPAAALTFDAAGYATLRAAGRSFHAGHFTTPTLGELRRRAEEKRRPRGEPASRLRFHVVDGASPATDIGTLQATAPEGSLFQVASQFNCLEAPTSLIVPVADYLHDGTQGPRASISAFPGTLLRHYAAPSSSPSEGAGRFVQQTAGPQLNLIEAACAEGLASVRSGYLLAPLIKDMPRFARTLEQRFDDLRVGLHDGVEVVLGHDWDGPVPGAPDTRVAHLLTSTLAAGGYGVFDPSDPSMVAAVTLLQRAAYAGTLFAAASLGKRFVVLTLIGGGVFGNPVPIIWQSLLWALDLVAPLLHEDMCVVLNGYSIGRRMPATELRDRTEERGGTVIRFEESSFQIGLG